MNKFQTLASIKFHWIIIIDNEVGFEGEASWYKLLRSHLRHKHSKKDIAMIEAAQKELCKWAYGKNSGLPLPKSFTIKTKRVSIDYIRKYAR